MNLKHALQTILLAFLTFTLQSCPAQTEPEKPIPEGYQSCCGTQTVVFKDHGTSIYIPNVFTPNGDGVNDLFMPSINSEVLAMVNLTLLTPGKDTVLFRGVTFVTNENLRENSWNGNSQTGPITADHSGTEWRFRAVIITSALLKD